MTEEIRHLFEQDFHVPEGIYWNDLLFQYVSKSRELPELKKTATLNAAFKAYHDDLLSKGYQSTQGD